MKKFFAEVALTRLFDIIFPDNPRRRNEVPAWSREWEIGFLKNFGGKYNLVRENKKAPEQNVPGPVSMKSSAFLIDLGLQNSLIATPPAAPASKL